MGFLHKDFRGSGTLAAAQEEGTFSSMFASFNVATLDGDSIPVIYFSRGQSQ